MTTAVETTEHYLQAFVELSQNAKANQPLWLRDLREGAFARFSEVGFPTIHDEDWRFTNLSPITRTNFVLTRPKDCQLSAAELSPWKLDGAAARLVFINGHFSSELSVITGLAEGVLVSGLKNQLADAPELVQPYLGHYFEFRRDPFSALNTAFIEDGAFVQIAPGIVLDGPIHLLFVSTAGKTPAMVHPRNVLVIGREAQAEIIEEYVSLGTGTVLCNSATELYVGENATASHFMIEREHERAFNISTLRIQQERSANVASHSILLGGGLVRNNVHPVLAGEGCECLINGLFVGNGRQHLDNYMYVEHASPHSNSRQFYNGILDGAAHGVFHGRIVVHKDAQKTDAKQTNRNLLLSDDAQIDTKPQLEIYADDVKCTHGATIGQMDDNALFYLRSRGIDEVSARRFLLAAFANECVGRMTVGVARSHVEHLIETHLQSIARVTPPGIANRDRNLEPSWEEVG